MKFMAKFYATYEGKIFFMKLDAKVYVKYLIVKFNRSFKGKVEGIV
jgi:hypothetical protein